VATSYSFAQLEQLWINAGGPAAAAPVGAAIALAESAGNPLAAYPGTTVAAGQGSTADATGLWQILGLPAGNFTAAELTDPVWNARMAVAKYQQAGNSFSPWATYTSGAYEQFLQSGVSPSSSGVPTAPAAAGATAAATAAAATGSTPQAQSLVSQAGSVVSDAGTLLHGAAETLNWAWEWFQPGQGWRLAFGAGAVALGYLGLRQWGLIPSASSVARAA
jgi:hypothetical protein